MGSVGMQPGAFGVNQRARDAETGTVFHLVATKATRNVFGNKVQAALARLVCVKCCARLHHQKETWDTVLHPNKRVAEKGTPMFQLLAKASNGGPRGQKRLAKIWARIGLDRRNVPVAVKPVRVARAGATLRA